MRKKVMAAVLTAAMVASISVVPQSVAAATDPSDLKIGLITDVGGVNDGSFNQSSWEGLEKAGEAVSRIKKAGEEVADAAEELYEESRLDGEDEDETDAPCEAADTAEGAGETAEEQEETAEKE